MAPLQYALVAYVQNPVGIFVEELRRSLYPEHGHLPAHITVLPPRTMHGTEEQSIATLRREIGKFQSFEAEMGEVESFFPTTPTVFLSVSRVGYRLREMHDALNVDGLFFREQWTYMPHMTIVKMPDFEEARRALAIARERWSGYRGSRSVAIERLSFVREGENNRWVDLAEVRLISPVSLLPR